MTPSRTSQETLHGIGVSQLLRAPALSLSIPQGMRQGGGTRGTIRSAAHFPSKAALELGRNLLNRIEYVPGVDVCSPQALVIDNRALEGHRARCGRDFRGQIWIDPTAKGPSAMNLKPCRKASEETPVVIGMKELAFLLDSKAHSHLAVSSSAALRPWQVEDCMWSDGKSWIIQPGTRMRSACLT